MKKTNVLLPLLLALFTTILEAHEKETIVTVDTLSNTIFMLTGKGGNVGLFIEANKAYMIDDQLLYERLLKKNHSRADQQANRIFIQYAYAR